MATYSESAAQRQLDQESGAAMGRRAARTPAWAIETYLSIREDERLDKKDFEARSKERQDRMELLEKFLLVEMNQRGEENITTKAGTAYKSPQMRVTMTDRTAVIGAVIGDLLSIFGTCESDAEFAEKAAPVFDIFTNHVNKDAIKTKLDNKIVVPGIDIKIFVACNVRKA